MKHRWRVAFVVAGVLGVSALASATTVRTHRGVAARPAKTPWPQAKVLRAATRAYECARAAGYFDDPILTIIDYSLPSTQRRLWVIDLARKKILFHELVAHGRESGGNRAIAFSGAPGSKMSSLGLFRTAEAYWGKHGFALRLDGLEPGFNETARERAIVLHGADYVSPRSIAVLGRLGRSWGCPAVSREVSRPLITRIQNGTALFAYYPDSDWLSGSDFLQCSPTRLAQRAG